MADDTPSAPSWSEDERPTEPTSLAAQVAIVAADMKAMTPERRKRPLRYAAALAALPKLEPK